MKVFIKDHWFAMLMLPIGFMLSVVLRQCETEIKPPAVHTIDTVIVNKPYEVKVLKNKIVPVKVYIYKDKDTILRNQREKEPIIEDIKIKKNNKGQVNEIDITSIDSSGTIKTEILKINPDSKSLEIDNTGQVEEKKKTRVGRILKKTWKGVKFSLMTIGGVTVAVLAVKYL